MTAPRQVLEGTTYLVTRRCAQREMLLRPSKLANALFGFILAITASRYGILVHAFCVMSNHYHLVVTDPGARLPEFCRDLDAFVARAMNASLGRVEAFWGPPSYSAVALSNAADVIDKAAYVLANPVAAGLVRDACDWPGLWSGTAAIGGDPLAFERPNFFFRANGPTPAVCQLALVPPPGFTALQFREAVEEATAAKEMEARVALASKESGFLGVPAILAQDPTARPVSRERLGGLNPRIAARDTSTRIAAIAGLCEFRRAYRFARRAFLSGVRDALFPAGTYLLRVHHGVRCAVAG